MKKSNKTEREIRLEEKINQQKAEIKKLKVPLVRYNDL